MQYLCFDLGLVLELLHFCTYFVWKICTLTVILFFKSHKDYKDLFRGPRAHLGGILVSLKSSQSVDTLWNQELKWNIFWKPKLYNYGSIPMKVSNANCQNVWCVIQKKKDVCNTDYLREQLILLQLLDSSDISWVNHSIQLDSLTITLQNHVHQ